MSTYGDILSDFYTTLDAVEGVRRVVDLSKEDEEIKLYTEVDPGLMPFVQFVPATESLDEVMSASKTQSEALFEIYCYLSRRSQTETFIDLFRTAIMADRHRGKDGRTVINTRVVEIERDNMGLAGKGGLFVMSVVVTYRRDD